MSTAVTSVQQDETEKFQAQPCSSNVTESTQVENVWTKRTLEKQLSANAVVSKPLNQSEEEVKPSLASKDDEDFQEVKNRKEKKDERKEEKPRKLEKRDSEKKDSVDKNKDSKKVDKEVKEEKEKKEEIVKKFDNVNYVEAPLPKTNPWAVNKPNAQNNEPGLYVLLKWQEISGYEKIQA